MATSQGRDTSGMSTLPAGYAALHSNFRWQVPRHFNMAQACSRRWAEAQGATKRIAIRAYSTSAESTFYSYSQLQEQANRLSHVLAARGVQRGDRVGIVLPQRFETAVAYMAVMQMGAVAMPLSMLFGPEALEFRLQDSEAVVAICDAGSLPALAGVRHTCPQLRAVVGVGLAGADAALLSGPLDAVWEAALRASPDIFEPVNTLADFAVVELFKQTFVAAASHVRRLYFHQVPGHVFGLHHGLDLGLLAVVLNSSDLDAFFGNRLVVSGLLGIGVGAAEVHHGDGVLGLNIHREAGSHRGSSDQAFFHGEIS